MAINASDTARIAKLARLHLSSEAQQNASAELNQIFELIAELQAVDTQNIEPLAHPLSMIEEVSLRLRDDAVTAPGGLSEREALMQNAPGQHEGLFLVPKVLE
jgi:aspartyl-tRNA(Asn)/glutamyl-tRNA(Gln) amidotransferase subunit C